MIVHIISFASVGGASLLLEWDQYTLLITNVIWIILLGLTVLFMRSVVSFYNLFVFIYLVLFAIYPITAVVNGAGIYYSSRLLAEYAFMTYGGISLFSVGYLCVVGNQVRVRSYRLDYQRYSRLMCLGVGVFVVSLVGSVILAGGIDGLINSTRIEIKLQPTTARLLITMLTVVATIFPLLAPMWLKRNLPLAPLFIALFVIGEIVFFLFTRARTVGVAHTTALFVGLLYVPTICKFELREKLRKKVDFLRVLLFASGVLIIAFIAMTARVYRGLFEVHGSEAMKYLDVSRVVDYGLAGGDLGYTATVFEVFEVWPEQAPLLYGQSYYRMLFLPIPRSLWSGKPFNTQRIVASILYPGIGEYTLPPGIQGDLYVNFWLFGVLGFIVFGIFWGKIDGIRRFSYCIFIGASPGFMYHFIRGGFTNPMLVMFVVFIVSIFIERYLKARVYST